jgi:Wzt C-terminal domain
MERGSMVQLGDPRLVGRAYHKLNFGQLPHEAPAEEEASSGTTITEAWFQNAAGERVTSAGQEDRLSMCFEVRLAEDLIDPVFAATLRTELGHTIIVARSDRPGQSTGAFHAGDTVIARFDMPNWLTPSRYTMTPSLARAGTGENALALVEDMTSVVVHGTGSGGILELPIDVRIERA